MEFAKADFDLFDREVFAFKQLKDIYPPETIQRLKEDYQMSWQKWKHIQMTVATNVSADLQPKVESWTNGWNLRSHFWCAYRNEAHPNQNACLAALINQKQYQVYFMFQHYKSGQRSGSLAAYNDLRWQIEEWSKDKNLADYYIWPQVEHELEDHCPLAVYLSDPQKQRQLEEKLQGRSFQIGKLWFPSESIEDVERLTTEALEELSPLYFSLTR
ncbi:glucose-6-phosphate 1-dehydrogenase family protein [Enterococcus gallinarum]|uniref:Glucose-6-phosphate 1-dehydrogenase family protein n=1 Tax=Enterococcus gallinarum TaxID=1353 RepID=A0A2K3QSZ6_ENTGA|nr:glucose-6-phosphate 1-dehydrogenase family protein [Enterococcus gallinarum]MBF0824450.1 glucose-6-phosphate 1-dehydrogenase family protein [Enterococcus faecalis]MBF0725471.1 glucose-6-phosphate 1-dehydrogenase family protein [Enterococcus gallinarum]MBF0798314.1 glucose-6-phosphate 1-dehydrogenase family protein [Enterococcus gallinarum]MBM6741189.1 glucose-6-phosphate 1-dehydrogenase family protein [Enterococcus gallinarum]MBX8978921.1 hypothetical protein [Enterococcus gallinarum]